MPPPFRLATFNCENLFSRPRIFQESPDRAQELLAYVAELQDELDNDEFDHERIKALKSKLRGFAEVNDIRGDHMRAKGAKTWVGSVDLLRERYSVAAIDNTARVIRDLQAQIICLIEVENRPLLKEFHDGVLVNRFLEPDGRKGYEHILLMDGNDQRGIDVSLLSQFPVTWMRSHAHERTIYMEKETNTFSRDCFVVRLRVPGGRSLTVYVNHLKSMGYSPAEDPLSNKRRLGQAKRLAELVGVHDLNNELVVVAGDLNSPPDSPSLAPIVAMPGLYNVNLELPEDERGTYRTGKKQLDYLLVSDALRSRLKSVRIERCGIYTKTRPHYPEVKSELDQASDHGAVVAEFQL